MELTRRDAVVALAVGGVAVAGGTALDVRPPRADDGGGGRGGADGGSGWNGTDGEGDHEALLRTLSAAAEVLYPSDVEGVRPFVETYVLGRVRDRDSYRDGVAEAAAQLDATARDWEGAAFADLDPEARDDLLRSLGVETAEPDADGPLSERIRRYVVNELLFAFYASPTGGRLVGIENPVGYPGGTESYRRAAPPGDDEERAAPPGDEEERAAPPGDDDDG
ncbi:MAG: gluconate 2-dehydrogenase subunit 3 family protein [Haloferacaceae archaeon]